MQNHIFQVLSNLTMEAPARNDAESLRDEKVKVLKCMPPVATENLVRGQFEGYLDEKGVAPDSKVETFAALRVDINSWRWQGVPFYIRAGKNMPVTALEILARLRRPPLTDVSPASTPQRLPQSTASSAWWLSWWPRGTRSRARWRLTSAC